MPSTGPSSDPQKCQVGSFKTVAGLTFVELTDAELLTPGDSMLIRFMATYDAKQLPGYPLRGSVYNSGDVALMPGLEATRLIALGGALAA